MGKKVVLIVIFVVLLAIAIYYTINQNQDESNLIGDKACGNLVSEELQNNCCAEAHKGENVIDCAGSWKYVNGMEICQFVCSGALPACTEEAKACDNGLSVVRNASNDCRFDACP